MNLFYGLAVMALDGAAFVDQYREDRLRDPAILAVIDRITAYVDPEIDALGAEHRHMARLKLTHRDGRVLAREERSRRGSPENPLTAEEVPGKFRALTRRCVSADDSELIIGTVAGLDKMNSLNALTDLLRT